jgi:hypothetical protein
MRPLSLFCLPLLALVGCSDPFAPYSRLDRLRVMAMQAEPATPLPGEATMLSALTFAPAGETRVYHWTWCPVAAPAGGNYACPLDQVTADEVFAPYLDAGSALPSLDLGRVATATFVNPFPLATLASLCATGASSPIYTQGFDCEGGYPVTVVLDVETASASLRAGFVLRLPASATPEINRNPGLAGLRLAGALLDGPPAAIRVAAGETIDLTVDVAPDAVETRSIPASEGSPGQRLERLTASWFADGGSIDSARTSFIDGVASLVELSRNRFTVPSAAQWPAGGLVELAVVLRDDRGGVGWLSSRALLEQAP